MEDAEKLRRAAELVEQYLETLPPTPWITFPKANRDVGEAWILDADDGLVAVVDLTPAAPAKIRWITLSPVLLRMFGEYLSDLADDAEEIVADARAVTIAEVVIAALGNNG